MESQKETEPINDSEKRKCWTTCQKSIHQKVYPGREDGGPVTRSKKQNGENLNEVGGTHQECKHHAKINLITAEQLKDPSQTFQILFKKCHQRRLWKGDCN